MGARWFIPEMGSNFENPSGRWTKVTEIYAVNLTIVHGHIFVLTSDGSIAYEYQDGPMPDLSSVRKEFFADFIDYLITNDLTNLLGLQVRGSLGTGQGPNS
jgi:hypothetical protein